MRNALLAGLGIVLLAGVVYVMMQDEDAPVEDAEPEEGRRTRRRPRPRPVQEQALANQEPDPEPGPEGFGHARRGSVANAPTNDDGPGATIMLGGGAEVRIAEPMPEGTPRNTPEQLAEQRTRQLEHLEVSRNRARAALEQAEADGDEQEVAALTEVMRQLDARQVALEEALAEGR